MAKVKQVTKTPLEVLQEKSANAVGIIRSTIEQLQSANDEVAVETERNNMKIKELETTNKALNELANSNSKIVKNFEALLS